MITVVLSDIDGTLVDSNDAHTLAWIEALEGIGHVATFDQIRPLIGMGGDKLMPALGVDPESPKGREAGARAQRTFLEKYLADVHAFPRARELLERIRESGRKIIAATSADDKEVHAIVAHAGIADMFESMTSSDDADESKPAPDIVVAALKRANAEPRQAVMLGDTPYDVRAASRANVRCIGFRCGGWDAASLAGAVAIYESPGGLLDVWADSILAK